MRGRAGGRSFWRTSRGWRGTCGRTICGNGESRNNQGAHNGHDRRRICQARALALGQHDRDYVDAYYGPPAWKTEATAAKLDLAAVGTRAAELSRRLESAPDPSDGMARLRLQYLRRQLSAVQARVRMLGGERLSFDAESKALYDAVAPTFPESHFQEILDRLEKRFPGTGPLVERYDAFRRAFVIPPAKLDAVFQKAIQGCAERTREHISLPPGEQFKVEYVTNKSWSGYNWYQGGFRSLIQVNTDLPIYIDRAVDLACHEGYPGHHVYNTLLEKHLVKDRGWVEFTVYPLFSPQSLIAEGSANFGIEVAFPGAERIEFERTVLFPAAGLDASRAAEYYDVQGLVDQLGYAGNEAARQYLDGRIDAAHAAAWLERYALMPHDRAVQRVKFFDQYPKLRDQLQPREGHGPTLRGSARGNRRPPGPALDGIREADLVAPPAVRTAVEPLIDAPGFESVRRTVAMDARCSGVPVPGGLRVRVCHRQSRAAYPVRRVQLLRLPALVVHLPRCVPLGHRAGLLRRRVSGVHRNHQVAGYQALGERASDWRRHHAGAILCRRPCADEMDEPVS